MLTIGKLGAGQEGYYLEKVADGAEDYYSGEGEAPGRWSGDGAAELGLEGDVVGDQLRAMLTGHHPATRAADRKRRGLPEPGPRPRLRPHLLRTEVGLAALGPRRPRDLGRGPRPTSPPSTPPSPTSSARPAGPGAAAAASSSSKETAT